MCLDQRVQFYTLLQVEASGRLDLFLSLLYRTILFVQQCSFPPIALCVCDEACLSVMAARVAEVSS